MLSGTCRTPEAVRGASSVLQRDVTRIVLFTLASFTSPVLSRKQHVTEGDALFYAVDGCIFKRDLNNSGYVEMVKCIQMCLGSLVSCSIQDRLH